MSKALLGIATAFARGQNQRVKLGPLMLSTVCLLFGAGPAASAQLPLKAGDAHELTLTKDWVEQTSDGSSQGSSHDQDSILERVLAVGPAGVRLEYDLPSSANADERSSQWQFPARVLKSPDGQLQLLNSSELAARVDRWLKAAGWPRTVCGHWIFTWNGFKIECNPQSTLRAIEAFDLTSVDLRDGALYRDANALEPGRLTRNGNHFTTELKVDPNAVRRARAETDVAIGQVTNKPVTLDAALRKHANDEVTGIISITFETDRAGTPLRRTKVTKLFSKEVNGRAKTETTTEVLERRPVQVR